MPGARPSPFMIGVALASAQEDDLTALDAILTGSAWKLIQVSTCREAVWTIRHLPVPIILCDLKVEDKPWQDTLRQLLVARKGARVIFLSNGLLSNGPDWPLSKAIAEQGGSDLLVRPLEREQVFQALFFSYSRYMLGGPGGSHGRLKTVAS